MDLKKKLEYYRKTTAGNFSRQEQKSAPRVPASVKAIAEHFKAKILPYPVPVLEISMTEDKEFEGESVKLNRLSKNQFTEPILLEDCLFFDLETTGLSGGTGTYPFLLGFGYFEGEQFKVVQYFLPDFGRDYYAFKEIQPLLEKKKILVSFNGKSYDFPLLKTRAILNRFEVDLECFEHLDLLHLSRRVWKDSQESCDLGSIEREQLNLQRSGDISGSLIPTAYLRFIQTGLIHEMISAIQHNQIDIFSLKKILFRLAEINEKPEVVSDLKALLRLANLAFELEDFEYFLRIEQRLEALQPEGAKEIRLLKSFFLKKRKEWTSACQLWETLVPHREYSFLALEELAKAYEHVFRDHQKALEYAQRALKIYQIMEQLNPYQVNSEWKMAFLRRFNRLKNKLT